MKKSEMEKWCAALESGKFGQTHGKLREAGTKNFCCLGVACHLKAPAAWDREGSILHSLPGVLPESIQDAMGMRNNEGDFRKVPSEILAKHGLFLSTEKGYIQAFYKGESGAPYLTGLNDSFKWDFKQIAAFIRDAYKWL